MARADEFRKQINELWKQGVQQLEEVKDALSESRSKIERDLLRLRSERDVLLKRLGEQTFKLSKQDKVPLPAVVQRTVERLNEVVENLVAKESSVRKAKKKSTTKKATTKKVTKKKTTKKKLS